MSHSSAEVTYRPAGPGHRARSALVDLARIPDPEAWLTRRLGPLASISIERQAAPAPTDAERLADLAHRLDAAMTRIRTERKAALDALGARLSAFAHPAARPAPPSPHPQSTEAHP